MKRILAVLLPLIALLSIGKAAHAADPCPYSVAVDAQGNLTGDTLKVNVESNGPRPEGETIIGNSNDATVAMCGGTGTDSDGSSWVATPDQNSINPPAYVHHAGANQTITSAVFTARDYVPGGCAETTFQDSQFPQGGASSASATIAVADAGGETWNITAKDGWSLLSIQVKTDGQTTVFSTAAAGQVPADHFISFISVVACPSEVTTTTTTTAPSSTTTTPATTSTTAPVSSTTTTTTAPAVAARAVTAQPSFTG